MTAVCEIDHHAWWMREVHEGRQDELAAYYDGTAPEERLRSAMLGLLKPARRQLGVKDPDDVMPDDPIDPRRGVTGASSPP